VLSARSNPRQFAAVLCILSCFSAAIKAAPGDYLSPLALVADGQGRTIYIAQETANQVAVFDVAAGRVRDLIASLPRPSGLALSPDGQHLYITTGTSAGMVVAFNLKERKVDFRMPAGHTPTAPVLSVDGRTLYLCNRFNNNVAVYDLASRKLVAAVAVTREPAAAALTADGKLLFVANSLPGGAADQEYVAADVSVIDTAAKKIAATIRLPNGSTSLHDICISPDGKYAYVTHILSRYHLPTTQLERGWVNTNALSIIDVPGKRLLNTVLLDDVDLGAANPWGVAVTADGKYICVTLAGTGQLCVIDRAGMHEKLAKAAAGEKVSEATPPYEDVPNDLAFLVKLKRRLDLAGNGPRDLVLIGRKAYVAEYFTGTLGVVDIESEVHPKARSIPLGPQQPLSVVRKGEMFFHDAGLCFQKWQSCSSCHPAQARSDGLNWDLLNDGLGNPKNTKSLLLAHRTPPAMALGVRSDAEAAVRAGIKHIQFAVRPEQDAVAIDEYLRSLKPLPSPYLQAGRLSQGAKRGRKIFKKAECATCHPAPLYTDRGKYDVGTGKLGEKGKAFDTPTLVEVWRTAPYLHDGRAATIREVLTKYNPADRHGKTSGLTDAQLDDLTEFILSL